MVTSLVEAGSPERDTRTRLERPATATKKEDNSGGSRADSDRQVMPESDSRSEHQ